MVEKIIGLTSFQAAVMTIGESTGILLGPVTAGFLLCSNGYMSIVYTIFAGCLTQYIILVVIAIIISLPNKREGSPPGNPHV